MKQEIIKIELTEKSAMELQLLGMETTVDLEHLPFTDFTLELPIAEEVVSMKDLRDMYERFCLATGEKMTEETFIKEVEKIAREEKVEIQVSINGKNIKLSDSDVWTLEFETETMQFNPREHDLTEPNFSAKSNEVIKAFNDGGDVAKSIIFNLPLALGVIAFLQSEKREEVKVSSKIDCKKKKGKKGSKSNSKKTYIYNKKYVFSDSTVSKDETDKRNYERKIDEWFTKGHWRHYKSGKKVWIDKTIKKAKTKTVESNNPVEKEYKITKVK